MRQFLIILAGLCAWTVGVLAQPLPDERIVAELRVRGLEKREMNILVRNNEAFIPVATLFDFLGIKADYDSSAMRLTGFFKTQDTAYVIDPSAGFASVDDKGLAITDQDYAFFGTELFIRMSILNELFDMEITYNSHTVTVEVHKYRDLPAYLAVQRHRKFQQLQKRKNMIPPPDLTLDRVASIIGAERLDWTVSSQFTSSQYLQTRYTLALGAQVLGGDGTARLVGFSDPLVHYNQNSLQGQVRFPFLNNPVVQQVTVGDYNVFGIQPRTVTGVEITNRPLAQRYFFSREVFRGQFEPHDDVELRGSNTGFQLQQTNDEGFYQFDIPMLYGQSSMEIHAYDPWGQERIFRYRMNVPRTVLPPGEVEYSISGGRIRPPSNILTSSGYFNYGVSSDLTVGGRVEYYDLNEPDKFFAAITGTSLLGRGLAFNALVAPQAISQASLDWLFPNYAEFSVTGAKYNASAFFNPSHINDDINASLTLPFSSNGNQVALSAFGGQTDLPGYRDRQIQLGLSAMFSVFSPSYSTQMTWRNDDGTGLTSLETHLSNASLGVYLPAGLVSVTDLIYDHILHETQEMREGVYKRLPNGLQFMASYTRLPTFETYNLGLQVVYYFPFARVQGNLSNVETRQSTYTAMATGSVSFDPRLLSMFFENSPSYVGYGGIVVHPFLDANDNGILDRGEESVDRGRVYYVNVTRGGMPTNLPTDKLSLDRVPTYEEYNIYLDPQSLDNPVWVPEFSSISMLSEPNYVRRIDIPVVSGGSIHGTVSVSDGTLKPVEGITVKLSALGSDHGGKPLARTTSTFSTGEFEFDLVPPGNYLVEVDATQPQMRGAEAQPSNKEVTIVSKADGDLVNGVDFVLKTKQ